MQYYERALELKKETIAHRRYFHTHAEVGLEMPKAVAYIMQKLKEYGMNPKPCGHGVTATIGKEGKTILLRADMDALPMAEESGELFACPTGTEAHTCGHDFHAAMLLTAAKMLKENEAKLKGTVKLMFQPAEETLEGCKDMIAAGILDNPKVDAALAFHVAAGQMPIGIYMYNEESTMMYTVEGFRIQIYGKGAHGAYPQKAIDPIKIGMEIYQRLQSLIEEEGNPKNKSILSIGQFQAGTAANVIPDTAVIQGTFRSKSREEKDRLMDRIMEISMQAAASYGGRAEVQIISDVPPLVCDEQLTEEIAEYMKKLNIPNMKEHRGIVASASEDFAVLAEQVPSTFMYLSAGFMDERGVYGAHNPKVRFNEEVCPIGVACYAHCATEWLAKNA